MLRREFLKILGIATPSLLLHKPSFSKAINCAEIKPYTVVDFGNFYWGVATAAYQIEGAYNYDGKAPSIWDTFTNNKKNKIKGKANGNVACNFYHTYLDDLKILKSLGFKHFRFSISWPRVLPYGYGEINIKGIDFYKRLIDTCLKMEIEPWVTLYHWDLPQALENKQGWLNRDIVKWFADYSRLCANAFGNSVKHWIVMNEPLSFTLFGYGIGIHAPGKVGLDNFFNAVHHAALAQAEGARVLREYLPNNAHIGTAFSCSPVEPYNPKSKHDVRAAKRIDAFVNRMFTEPLLGWGYPYREAPIMHRIDKYMKDGDEKRLAFDFDFWGLQHYFRILLKGAPLIPILKAYQVKPSTVGNQTTKMNWEIFPEAIYNIIKQFEKYPIKELIITENGASFEDKLSPDGTVNDTYRIEYFKKYLFQILKAKNEGAPVTGYFVWTLMDNFEWAEGYEQRFGLLYNNFNTQQRYLKNSAFWWKEFLKNEISGQII